MTEASPILALAPRRVRHEPVRRVVTVIGAEPVGANGISVTFGGEALAGFTSLSFDDHCKFIFTTPDGDEIKRDFTPRRFDPHTNRLTLEFALHDGGLASEWARWAEPGTEAAVAGPKSSVVIPTGYDWHLLAGDATAAPAIARRIEELPAGTRAMAVLFDPAGSGKRELFSRAEYTVQWAVGAQEFVDLLRGVELPEGQGFVWCAGEAGLMAQVRDLFLNERGHPKQAMRISGYWKQDSTGFHETLENGLG